jgi:hypothetical protein
LREQSARQEFSGILGDLQERLAIESRAHRNPVADPSHTLSAESAITSAAMITPSLKMDQ